MEPSKEAINVRLCYLNKQLCGSSICNGNSTAKRWITKETLLDALSVLYEECNNEPLKKSDEFIAKFVERYRPMISELRHLRVNISDFEIKHLIGRGHFGEVHVVKEKRTGFVYAMKTLKKDVTLKHQSIAFFEEERDIMALSKSNWLVKLQYAFQDSSQLYLVMEYCPGGDLSGLLERRGRPLSEKDAIFYIAEMIEGLKELHMLGFVHRDIKPDNVLLDRCGHLKLADFGSATRLSHLGNVKDSMPIGTTDYIAPEILMALENPKKFTHGPPCDYWSLGIVAYELVTRKTPFASSSKTVIYTYKRIVEHGSNTDLVHLKYSNDVQNISNDYKIFIENLLHPNPAKRPDHSNITKFTIFNNTHWNSLLDQTPPFVPIVNGQDDASNFLEIEKQKPTLSVENFRSKSQFNGRNLPFIGFTYAQDINLSNNGEFSDDVKKISDTTSSSGHSSESNGVFNTSLNGTAICLSNARETEKLLESRKKEIDILHKKLAMSLSKQKLLEEKEQKMMDVEKHRSELEKDLAEMACKNQKLQHQLESEHKERKILETKSLQLIRCAKRKWKEKTEEQVSSLNKKISELEMIQTDCHDTARSLEYQLQSKSDSLDKCLSELNILKKFKENQKENFEKTRMLSRQSINEMDKISQESNRQLKVITQKFNDELKLKTKLESELQQLQEEQILSAERENNLLRTISEDKYVYSKEIVQWTEKYNIKCEEVSNLQETISVLQNQIFDLNSFKEKLTENEKTLMDSVSRVKRQSESDTANLKDKIHKLSFEISKLKSENIEKDEKIMSINKEKNDMKSAFEKAIACEEKHKERVSVLEEMVNKLQLEVTAFETIKLDCKTSTPKGKNESSLHLSVENIANAERICVLQEQIVKLEGQLKLSMEECILMKQDARKANSALWKKEKEFSDCDLDRRFAERELKEAKTQISTLQNDMKQSNVEHEKTFNDLRKLYDNQGKEFEEVKKTITSLNSTIVTLERKIKNRENIAEKDLNENSLLKQKLSSEIQSLNDKIEKLETDLQSTKNKQLKAENLVEKYIKENKTSEGEKHIEREQRIRLEVTLQERVKECDSLKNNYKILQNTCTLLEEQLIDFEKVIEVQDTQSIELKDEIQLLKSEVEKYQAETSKVRKQFDVQNFNFMSTETKCNEYFEKLKKERTKNSELEKQVNVIITQEAVVSSEVTNKSVEIAQLQSELKIAKVELNAKLAEITALKEECTHLLTDVANLREDNMNIQLELEEFKGKNLVLQTLLKDREEELSARQYHWQQCEMKAEATISQQIKLIDFLQTKVEEVSKRKKTFSDMLFGKSTSKEIIILPSTPQTPINNRFSRDESQSALREKIKNQELETPVILREKNKSLGLTPAHKSNIEKKDVSVLIDGCVRIQKGSLLVKVHMKLFENELKWQDEKDYSQGEFSLQDDKIEIKKNLEITDMQVLLSDTEKKNAFKIVTYSEKYQQKSLLIVCTTSQQKENWISKLKDYERIENKIENFNNLSHFNIKPFTTISKNQTKLHFIVELKNNLFLIGGEKSLFCFYYDHNKKEPIIMPGINGMRKVKVVINIDQIIFLDTAGKLMHMSLRQFVSYIKSLQNLVQHDPLAFYSFDRSNIPNVKENFDLFDVSKCEKKTDRVLVCATTSSNLLIYEYDNLKMLFTPLHCMKTETISCIKFTKHTIIVGSQKFYEIDLKSFKVEEFLDPSEASLSHAVYAYKKNIYPLEIIQTKTEKEKIIEYLLCYNSFGVFVDEYGQRTRPEDISWTNHPSNIVFRKPFIFITYYSAVEIIHLKDDSFLRTWSDRDSINSTSGELCNLPTKIIVDFNSPYFLGKSISPSSIFLSQSNKNENRLEIFEFNGIEIFKNNLACSVDTLDTIDDVDSCKNIESNVNVSSDSDSNFTDSSSLKTNTDFSTKIREKAKIINSLKQENNKVNRIQEMLSSQKHASNTSDDLSDTENSSSSEEYNFQRHINPMNGTRQNFCNVKEKKSVDTTPVLRKKVRFNKSPI